ncbi:MAG: DinB family protein [Chloroflexi bacterium]|nr:DinB family protein [Chloroflexota bacterium]
MSATHEPLLKKYLQLPDRLEAAIAGLSEADLDLTKNDGWPIRAYVHHTVEGELMWQLFLRAILGQDGIEIPIAWYFGHEQEEWGRRWVYGKRAVGPTLALFRGSTATLAELLRNVPPEAWDHFGRVTWPGDEKETRLTVRDIVLMHIRHMDGHTADIRTIRELHGA